MRRVALAILGTIAGLVGLLSFKTHSQPVAAQVVATSPAAPGSAAAGGSPGTGTTPSTTSPSTSSPSGSSSTSKSSSSKSPSSSKTVTGDAVDTRWGPVQVRITVTNGKITAATAVVFPEENPRDQQINSYAIPALNKEAVQASSAKIDMISGATYTSDGYIGSLQSALTKAGL